MEVNIRVQRRPEALDSCHCSASTAANSPLRRSPTFEPKHRADKHTQHRTTQLMIPCERVAQSVRQRQHPLAHRQAAEHAIDEVRCQLGHAPAAARRTKPAPLA
jgi:hypothetical protein